MRLRKTAQGVLGEVDGQWVDIAAALRKNRSDEDLVRAAETDVLALLKLGDQAIATVRAAAEAAKDDPALTADPTPAGLPFTPRSMRAFMLWEDHVIASARMLVKNFFPKPAWKAVSLFEKTGRTFPKFKPNERFWEAPTFYVANHPRVLADGQDMWWPSHTKALDFELELAFVLRAPLVDATPEEAVDAIGGWMILNDWSARDVQADDYRRNIFGPVVKSKTFANSLGSDVVTADEFGDWKEATGRVRVDGEVWAEGATKDPAHDVGEMLAFVSKGERLDAGDVFSTGTMPGCCGLELNRWIKPGQTIELEIDRIGTLTNKLSDTAVPTSAIA